MPEEEEAPQNETKVEDADCALHCYVNHCQGYPVHVLKHKNLRSMERKKEPKWVSFISSIGLELA